MAETKKREARNRDPRVAGADAVTTGLAQTVKPLMAAMLSTDLDASRTALRALRRIVSEAGRPDADDDRAAVIRALAPYITKDKPPALRREALWLLADLAGDESVDAVAALLAEADFREDARMALDHIPGEKSLAALKAALAAAPEDFRPNLAASLRRRGATVDGYPSKRLVPEKATKVGT